MMMASTSSAASLQEALENAGRLIDRQLQEDRMYPDLSELLMVSAPNSPTVSGMSDMDYPLQGPGLLSVPSLPEISTIRRVPLPPELVEQFGHMQCNCMMGVFPPISRAWLTIDSDIFMWNYEDGPSSFYGNFIKYAIGVWAILVGSGVLNDSMCGGMQLLPDPLYSLPTDNTYLLTITSTESGRIFLAGKDGCLYEVAYQAEAGWFSQRCRKINHSKSSLSFLVPSLLQFTFSEDDPIVQIEIDNSRNILYTRSEKGVIQVYDLGHDGQGMSRVASVSQNAIVCAAGNIARTIDRSVFKPIVQIAVIENSESLDCQLLAVTHAGVRLYFSTCPFRQPLARPNTLTLVHVRLPPGFSASSTVEKPSKVHKALYSKGILLMTASENEDNDILWCINHDTFPFQKPMMETQMTTRVDGHSWALSAIDDLKVDKIITPLNKDHVPITDSPVVVQQHMLPPKKFVLLSAQGSLMFHKLRPVDQLRHLLVSNVGGDGEEIERFFKLHQEDQACATCLILACSTAACDREVSAWATRAFFRYGGEAQMRFPATLPTPSNVGPILGSPMYSSSPVPSGGAYPSPSPLGTPCHGAQPPILSTPMYALGNPAMQAASMSGLTGPEIVYSGKHNGICIYFSRIMGNIWDASLVVERVFKSSNREITAIESSVPSQLLESVLQELKGLQEFLDRNSQFSGGPLGNPNTTAKVPQRLVGFMRPENGNTQQMQQELQRKFHEAQLSEKISLQAIQQLVRKSYQALALWKLLCEHQFTVIVGELQKVFVLQERGANELLQRSRQVQNKSEKERMLRESLKEYQKISNQVDLPSVCAQYRQVRFYEGVVELSLTAAEKKDPQGLGLHFYKHGEPEDDVVGLQTFQERLNSYKCITDTLQELVNQSKAAPQSPSVPKKPGPPVLSSDPNMLSNEEAGHHFEQMLKLAQRSKDELFSIALYNWLIQADLADKLLQIASPFLEPHLVRMAKVDQNRVRYMDLLWRYYEKNRSFSSAARVLSKLADMHSTEISLQQRLEYIARAILSAKSSTAISSIAADGEFLHELEEKMEVARIQLQIQETLQRQYSHHSSVQDAISQLDSELMDITKLYGEFADPFKLAECKLAIIHCAGYSDPILVHTLWQDIIEKELNDSVTLSSSDRMHALSLKLVLLGKIYAGTPRFFPLDFIVLFLEQQVCTLNWDVGFVIQTMNEIGVPLPRLLEVYDQLFKSRIRLEVLTSTSIKQKKPWPRVSWLGQENEAVFLLDEKFINEINLLSGRTKKKIPSLQPLLKDVFFLAISSNDVWLSGVLTTGELFLWNKDQDCVKMIQVTEKPKEVIKATIASSLRLYLYVAENGKRVLLITSSGCILLWEYSELKNILSSKSLPLVGQWFQIIPEEAVLLPSSKDKEAVVDAVFVKNELFGDCCLCSFTFYSGECLKLTFLAIQWYENVFTSVRSLPFRVHWAQQEYLLCSLTPKCESVKSRGALISAFSRDGLALAVTLNQRDPKATQLLFINTLNFVTLCGGLKGCSNKNPVVPATLSRSYWVGDISWTHDSLFLACVLKRGSLVLLTCLGELLTLVTLGCSIEFGPAEFIPLHPLITYRPQQFTFQDSNNPVDSSASDSDPLRQRFSIKAHSRLPYLIISDGYMVTSLRFLDDQTPTALMRSLLIDSTQRLEEAYQSMMLSKPKHKGLNLRSLDSLRSSLLKRQGKEGSVHRTVPRFLQEEETMKLSETTDVQDSEGEEANEVEQFPNSSFPFCNQRKDLRFSIIKEGRLEFATMFDTVHAKDDSKETDRTTAELHCIQKKLLAAWTIGISKNVTEKNLMLNYTVLCITHFFYVLQFIKCPLPKSDLFLNESLKHNTWVLCVFQLFHQCLSVHYWDLRYKQDVGHLIKLTSNTVKLFLTQQQKNGLFSEKLLACLSLLRVVADHLDGICKLQPEAISASADGRKTAEMDSLMVPIFSALRESWSWDSPWKICPQVTNLVQKPSHRLIALWRLLYKQTLWYGAQLSQRIPDGDIQLTENITHEISFVKTLLCHLQTNLQMAGDSLNQALELTPINGEECFLLGSYEKSVHLWKKALQETQEKGGRRMCFLQLRYYLSLLYCHLYRYNLNDAQGLCDHLVREILSWSQLPVKDNKDCSDSEKSHCEFAVTRNVHPEAAVRVVQCMARFMAAYFTNEPLCILPPHSVNVLPPLHIKTEHSLRLIPLQHSKVASFVRDQNLSNVWTVEYALELLLIGGLIPEAVWLAHKLGDWKTSVSIGVAFQVFCKHDLNFVRFKKKGMNLPFNMIPAQIFQEKLQYFLGQPVSFEAKNEKGSRYKQFTDPIEEEDANLLFGSMQEVLKASVMADADIVSETLQLLMDSAKDFRSFLFTSFSGSIRVKGSLPSLSSFPESLLNYCKGGIAFIRPGAAGDHKLDEVSIKALGCFRELCALCWMLHIRDKLSYSCRQYQKARENVKVEKVAEIFVKAFPNPEAIRVPLREKYHSLQQKLRHGVVKGPQTEELMSVVMRSVHKVRVKALKRVQRNIGASEMNIWEPDEEEKPDAAPASDRFSLGTSLSRSTLTELGSSLVHSDADTFSETLSFEEKPWIHLYQRHAPSHMELTLVGKPSDKKKTCNQKESSQRKEDHETLRKKVLPTVGAWEFERDDDEYINFLELFLSYVLERDLCSSDPGIPFLTSFSGHLREHELNSLLFDMHTSLKRRQSKTRSESVYRAGSCFAVIPESHECEKLFSLNSTCAQNVESQVLSASELVNQSASTSDNLLPEVTGNERKAGLFGLKQKPIYRIQDDKREKPLMQRPSNQSFSIPKSIDTGGYRFQAVEYSAASLQEDVPLALENMFRHVGRLVEWMVRWSDRRLLCDSGVTQSSCKYSPVIRVKTSTAAILTSLWLLEQPYCAAYRTKNGIIKVLENHYPESQVAAEEESNANNVDSPVAVAVQAGADERNDQNECYQSIWKMPAEAENPEVKEIDDEIIPVTHKAEKEFVDVVENHSEVDTFTRDEMDMHISDCEVHRILNVMNLPQCYLSCRMESMLLHKHLF
ncbi:Nucleoporin [Cricetulus griseus]|nr:Nucleoporin [Cricetulus griseus]